MVNRNGQKRGTGLSGGFHGKDLVAALEDAVVIGEGIADNDPIQAPDVDDFPHKAHGLANDADILVVDIEGELGQEP